MTSHPSIDLFIDVSVAMLTQGNWTLAWPHVSAFIVCGVGGKRGGAWMLSGTTIDGAQAVGI